MNIRSCRAVVFALGLGVAAVTLPLLHAQVPPADLIRSNGKIITVDESFSIAQAVAVRGIGSWPWAPTRRSPGRVRTPGGSTCWTGR